jgi:hypothetical protein
MYAIVAVLLLMSELQPDLTVQKFGEFRRIIHPCTSYHWKFIKH